jgi:hypothetical protein
MLPNPNLLLAVSAVVAIALAWVIILLGMILSRLRTLPVNEVARPIDGLSLPEQSRDLPRFRVENGVEQPSVPTAAPSPSRDPGRSFRADGASAGAVGGPTLIAVPNLSAPPTQAATAVAADLGHRFGEIWELADSGTPAEAIARRTGQPIGQVELILALRRQLAASLGSRV